MVKKYFLLLIVILTASIAFPQSRKEIVNACFNDICIEISKESLKRNENIILPERIRKLDDLRAFLLEKFPKKKNPLINCCNNLNQKSKTYNNQTLPAYWNNAITQFTTGILFDKIKVQQIIDKYEYKITLLKEQVLPKVDEYRQINFQSESLQIKINELNLKLTKGDKELLQQHNENKKLEQELRNSRLKSRFLISFACILSLFFVIILIFTIYNRDLLMSKLLKYRGNENNKSTPQIGIHTNKSNKSNSNQPKLPEQANKKTKTTIFSIPRVRKRKWLIVNGKSIGRSHLSKNQPCQDYQHFEQINKTWGIAVNCDGMGSGDISQIGSEKVAINLVKFFRERIVKEEWFISNSLPSNNEWNAIATETLKGMKAALAKYALSKNYDFQQLSTTLIITIYSRHGLLIAHIGDGRAGYCNDKGIWNSAMIPHKGEEANETIFITSNWDNETVTSSGVGVPECRVIEDSIRAFTLMSDGCEQHFFETKVQDPNYQNKMLIEKNLPHVKTMNGIISTIYEMIKDKIDEEEIRNHFSNFIKEGTPRLKSEPDDKSIIIGIFH